MPQINIISWNCNSIQAKSKLETLNVYLSSLSSPPHVILLQEANIASTDANSIIIPYYTLLVPHHPTGAISSVAALIHNSINNVSVLSNISFSSTNDSTETQCILLQWKKNNISTAKYILFNCYISPSAQQQTFIQFNNSIKKLFDFGNQNEISDIIIAGDLNAFTQKWSNITTVTSNFAGIIIDKIINDYDLHIINNIFCTTTPNFTPTRAHAIHTIDLILSTSSDLVTSFNVDTTSFISNSSDHYPLNFSIQCFSSIPTTTSAPISAHHQWNITNYTNWEKYTNTVNNIVNGNNLKLSLMEFLPSSVSLSCIDEYWKLLKNILVEAATDVISIKLLPPQPKPGFNTPKVIKAVLHLRQCKKIKQRNNNNINRIEYKKAREELLLLIKSARYNHFMKKLKSVSIKKNSKQFWNTYNKYLNKSTSSSSSPSSVLKVHHPITNASPSSPSDSLNNLACTFSNASVLDETKFSTTTNSTNDSAAYNRMSIPEKVNTIAQSINNYRAFDLNSFESYNKDFELNELIDSIKCLPHDTASGPDLIHPLMLIHAPPSYISYLLLFFNLCFHSHLVPTDWKHARIQAIHKKDDITSASNYRPISITSVVARTYERILYHRLLLIPDINSKLSPYQSGFRHKRGTQDNLLLLINMIQSRLRRAHLPVIFLDIARAYDATWTNGLVYKLHHQYNITGHMWSSIYDFITNRTFTVNHSTFSSDVYQLQNGVPQGSILSPLLFSLFINDITKAISEATNNTITPLLFADDIVLVPNAKIGKRSINDMKLAIDSINEWANKWYVSFSAAKSGLLPFSTNKHKFLSEPLLLQNQQIPVVQKYKYLGLIFTSNLSWKLHYESLLHKCKSYAGALCSIISRSPIVSPVEVRTLVSALILSRISYSLPFINLSQYQLDRLQSCITRPLLKSLSLPYSTHRSSLLSEFGLIPLHLYQQFLHIKILHRTLNLEVDNNPATALYQQIYTSTTVNNLLVNSNLSPPAPVPLSPFSSQISPTLMRSFPIEAHKLALSMINSGIKFHLPSLFLCPISVPLQFKKFYKNLVYQESLLQLKNDTSTSSLVKHFIDTSTSKKPIIESYLRQYCNHRDKINIINKARFRLNRLLIPTRQQLFNQHRSISNQCQYCQQSNETIEHILLNCDMYYHTRYYTELMYNNIKIEFSTKNILNITSIPQKYRSFIQNISNKFINNICKIREKFADIVSSIPPLQNI